jgi:hypothetical protein
MYVDDSDPFVFRVLPIDDPDEPMPPSSEIQQEALDDIACQLITYLTDAANDKSDPMRPAYILAHCDQTCAVYAEAGFDMLAEFQYELRTDLGSALRKARLMSEAHRRLQ